MTVATGLHLHLGRLARCQVSCGPYFHATQVSGVPSFRAGLDRRSTGLTILPTTTGHYYVKSRYLNRTYAPDGKLWNTKVYWGPTFKDRRQASCSG